MNLCNHVAITFNFSAPFTPSMLITHQNQNKTKYLLVLINHKILHGSGAGENGEEVALDCLLFPLIT